MGGDQLVAALCGDEVEEAQGEDIRAAEKALYMALIDEVEPLHGARELIEDLKRLGRPVVLASSAKPDEIEHYLDLLDARGAGRRVDERRRRRADQARARPRRGRARALGRRARGDGRRLDVGLPAAANAGVETIAVLTGGFSEEELREAGALAVFESIDELRQRLSETPLG